MLNTRAIVALSAAGKVLMMCSKSFIRLKCSLHSSFRTFARAGSLFGPKHACQLNTSFVQATCCWNTVALQTVQYILQL